MSITLEKLRVPVTIQADGQAKGRITANASVYDVVSATGHRIHAGAFEQSLQERGLPMLSWEHAWELGPMGDILDIQDGPDALTYNAQLYLDSDLPNRLHRAILAKNVRDNSFAFMAQDSAEVQEDGETIIDITRAELFEVTLCVVGANPQAGVIAAQALLDADADKHFAEALERLVAKQAADRAAELEAAEAAEAKARLLRSIDINLAGTGD